jgi:SNF2 family DNA or RNA helicase
MTDQPRWKHQEQEFREHTEDRARGRFWEMGTGKTRSVIDEACELYRQRAIDAVVVVAPNGVHRNWKTDELPQYLPMALQHGAVRAEYWETSKSATKTHIRRFEQLHEAEFPWALLSYDAVMTERGRNFLWKFLRKRRVLYALDESSEIKSPGAKRTIRIVASGKYAPYRRVLDGTPVSKGPFDIYSQIKFLDENFWPKHRLGSYSVFKKEFGVWFTRQDAQAASGYDPGYDKLIGYKNLERLEKIVSTISSRVLKEDVLDLPPKIYLPKAEFTLTAEQVRVYNGLKNEFVATVGEGRVVEAELAIVRLLRYQQVLSGYVYTTEDDENVEPFQLLEGGNPRLKLLGEIVQRHHHKAIIWARFTKDIDQIMRMLSDMGGNATRYDGTLGDDEAADNSERFKRGDAQWIVANAAKGARGLTWNVAHHVVYYNNSFRLAHRLQSEDRAHRGEMQHSVDYTDIVGVFPDGKQTVDHHIVNNLRNKFDIAAIVNGDRLREWI